MKSVLETRALPHFLMQIGPDRQVRGLFGIKPVTYHTVYFQLLRKGEVSPARRGRRFAVWNLPQIQDFQHRMREQ